MRREIEEVDLNEYDRQMIREMTSVLISLGCLTGGLVTLAVLFIARIIRG